MKSKFTKVLIAFSSFLALAVLVLIFKIQGDNKKSLENKKTDAAANSGETQGEINSGPTESFPIDNTPVNNNPPATTPAKVTNPTPAAPAPTAKSTKKTRTS